MMSLYKQKDPSFKHSHLAYRRLRKGHRACLSPSLNGSYSIALNVCELNWKMKIQQGGSDTKCNKHVSHILNLQRGINMNHDLVAKRFKQLREKSGLTQLQIAEYLNFDQSLVSSYEKNERQLSIDMLDKLSNLFGYPIDYFTSEDSICAPLPFAFKNMDTCVTSEDLEAVAAINKIALNLRDMECMLK